ncbi:Rne/Rng family ribonuclease [Corynebacterium diphtheriae]|uniref:translation initiation factor IF-2 N-terminal domain-containing protein n=1 Tax=Corynebacterium diphtheriae TaxID=1717 RepID=UPI000F1210DD|nr:translation initiation factor IF-2 N-terminal domain-containing protein [Corynebacterium diphtheriae]MBG9221449.1 translation initiation factor IF-2 N-terminal domain-containing protein [Corynebacterium diphtheriae bv. mitis]MBG9300680.1 translation initiation factor IF-2 N-terminal domain-containing protein [Corynebacterium diphtheriae bv. mitis]RKW84221.1 Rne/Rng family ribonuclease [Corynebacterium diphtheriae]RKW88026.1 Rne/Rng family ribonuclease [Corynebacterium diphtheriae]
MAEKSKKPTKHQAVSLPIGQAVAALDRSVIGEKIRVHILAKELGTTSKELIAQLATLGMSKVAQSTLSNQEANQLLDSFVPAQPEVDEKLRHRVEKNVENEIAQIEAKVNRDLEEAAANNHGVVDSEEEKLRYRVEKNVDNEVEQIKRQVERELSQRSAEVEDLHEVIELEKEAEPLQDVEPESAPAPASVSYSVPLFIAPTVVDDELEEVEDDNDGEGDTDDDSTHAKRRRRGRRGAGRGKGADDSAETVEAEEITEPVGIKGSTRLEAQRRRRAELREESKKKRHIVSEAEFLARRESVTRTMVVRERDRVDHHGMVTQVGVLEDGMLVEHFVTSEAQASMIGNIYLGRVQNVLPSMEAAFIDIGKGRNGVLYAGEVDWRAAGLGGRGRRIEQALKSGDQVLVQVAKDPIGHKGARLTTQISFAGRYLVYVPGGRTAGISRKLPAPERKRLKEILKEVVPHDGGAIIRTAAENVSAEAIGADVKRLHKLWDKIQQRTEEEKASKGAKPVTMYEEPNMLVKVVRDLFNEDFTSLVIDGDRAWNTVHAYVQSVAPDLLDRLVRFDRSEHEGRDAFEVHRVNEQIKKALSRKVWLPSGGTLVIDRTEAMTVIDVNTGKFTGAGGNLEETVTKNNLEAAEEIVRQMRLRDLGGMIVVDFIDMVLPENQDLVLRRLTEALGRDRTRHQVSEVTSLGLVQMTRKRLGTGLLETFATECSHCEGRGVIIHDDPVEQRDADVAMEKSQRARSERKKNKNHAATEHPAAVAMHQEKKKVSIEDLVAAVVIDDEPQPETEVAPAPADDDVMNIVSAALDRAYQEDPDEPSGSDYLPLEERPQTYAEAVAEYERSPRRKRKTRGNSVSDVPPRKADFEKSEPQPEPEIVVEKVSSRGRRRAVRRTVVETTPEVVAPTETAESSRGRRRAVRKKMAPQPVQTEAVVEDKREVSAPSQGGRGRRRASRRAPRR